MALWSKWKARRQQGREHQAAHEVREFVYWNPDAVEFDSTVIRFVNGRTCPPRVERVPWDEITKVVAYKWDCFGYDLVCVKVFRDQAGHFFDESFHGWEELVRTLSVNLPGAMGWDDFWDKVVQPPFATNFTVIYERAPRP